MTRSLLALASAAIVAGLAAASAPAASASCPSSNPPNTLVLGVGTDQTAKLGHAFGESFQVQLANTNGCSVTGTLAGTGIQFVAPAGGASGTFSSTGTSTAVVATSSSGVATAPTFTANDTAGTYTVHAVSDYGTVVFTVTNTSAGVAASIAAASGGSQAATVNGRFGDPLQARVLDAAGHGVPGATVAFVLAASQTGAAATFLGGGAQTTATTDSSGLATSPPLVANGTPGRFTATASTDGLSAVATYDLDNHAAATAIAAALPALRAVVGNRYAQPLEARVLDAGGQPLEGASVTFSLTAAHGGAGASFLGGSAQATVYADANGLATSPPLVANTTAGSFTATASVAGSAAPASYALRNLAAKPAAIAAGAGSSQTAAVRSRFAVRLAVTVTDAQGNAVPGALVTFAAPARGAGGRFGPHRRRVVRVRTDVDGVAVAPAFRANAKAGGYAVRAAVRGAPRTAAFALVNLPRARGQ